MGVASQAHLQELRILEAQHSPKTVNGKACELFRHNALPMRWQASWKHTPRGVSFQLTIFSNCRKTGLKHLSYASKKSRAQPKIPSVTKNPERNSITINLKTQVKALT